jgi:hypothetical protein
MILPTRLKRRLERARRAGADRIYGEALPATEPALYRLQALDPQRRCRFRDRHMPEETYFAAVRYWIELGRQEREASGGVR